MESLEVRMASISALLINTLRPWSYTPVSLPSKGFIGYIEGDSGRAGFSLVKPRVPRFGLQSRIWTKQDEEEAKLAVKGEYFMTGDKQKGQRTKP